MGISYEEKYAKPPRKHQNKPVAPKITFIPKLSTKFAYLQAAFNDPENSSRFGYK